jgi:chemotaxis signal transduction protein
VVELPAEKVAVPTQIFTPETMPPLPLLQGVARLDDGLLLILDLATFLSREEERLLARALARERKGRGDRG